MKTVSKRPNANEIDGKTSIILLGALSEYFPTGIPVMGTRHRPFNPLCNHGVPVSVLRRFPEKINLCNVAILAIWFRTSTTPMLFFNLPGKYVVLNVHALKVS